MVALQDRVCSDTFEAQAVASSLRGGMIVRALWATKAGLDKLTFDMAQDFEPYGVAVVSI
jgi:NAD(P)-dependent dehydrogenase (short-subunit alcohol dehydrogenase family)